MIVIQRVEHLFAANPEDPFSARLFSHTNSSNSSVVFKSGDEQYQAYIACDTTTGALRGCISDASRQAYIVPFNEGERVMDV